MVEVFGLELQEMKFQLDHKDILEHKVIKVFKDLQEYKVAQVLKGHKDIKDLLVQEEQEHKEEEVPADHHLLMCAVPLDRRAIAHRRLLHGHHVLAPEALGDQELEVDQPEPELWARLRAEPRRGDWPRTHGEDGARPVPPPFCLVHAL